MHEKVIVIADDEPHVTYLLASRLMKEGAVVHVANDGAQALRLILEHLPHLVISDFQMPVLSGFDMAVKLRENLDTTNTPIIMLTARGHRLIPSDLAKTNICQLMAKPFSMHDLLARAREILQNDAASGHPLLSEHRPEAAA